jgi:Sporulation protein and related proteins
MFKPLFLLLTVALFLPAPVSASEIPSAFQITGSGYGHGVGLSQIGARSKALAGETATAILNYYYKDLVISPLDDSKILRVNVGHLLSTARISTSTPDAVLQIFSGDIGDAQDVVPLAVVPAKGALNFSILGSTVVPSMVVGKSTHEPGKKSNLYCEMEWNQISARGRRSCLTETLGNKSTLQTWANAVSGGQGGNLGVQN